MTDEPCGTRLNSALSLVTGRCLRQPRSLLVREDRVREEASRAPRIVIALIKDHTLARTDVEDGLADLTHRRALPRLDAESLGKLRVPHGSREGAEVVLEGNRKHHVAAGRAATGHPRAFEDRVSVRELAVGSKERPNRILEPIPRAYTSDDRGHFLPVRADVLHGSGTHRSRNA